MQEKDSARRPQSKQQTKQQKSVRNDKPTTSRSRQVSVQQQPGRSQSCVFCEKLKKIRSTNFGLLLTKALYSKYSSSQNYYYSKDINDLIEGETTPQTVNFRDLESLIDQEEFLKRYYNRNEIQSKQQALLEYYKYHKDIPRLFMKSVYNSINRFHDKRRRLEYARVKRHLGLPDDDEFTKHFSKDKREKGSRDISVRQMKELLKGVNLEDSFKKKFPIPSKKQEILSQSHSLSFHLKDLLIVINNEKVAPIIRPSSGYPIGNEFSIFDRTLQDVKTFEDISRISTSHEKKHQKLTTNDLFKKIQKLKPNPSQISTQPNQPTHHNQPQHTAKLPQPTIKNSSLSPTQITIAQGFGFNPQNQIFLKNKLQSSTLYQGSQTDRVKAQMSQDTRITSQQRSVHSKDPHTSIETQGLYNSQQASRNNSTSMKSPDIPFIVGSGPNMGHRNSGPILINSNLIDLQNLLVSSRNNHTQANLQRKNSDTKLKLFNPPVMKTTQQNQMGLGSTIKLVSQQSHGRTRSQDNLPTPSQFKAQSPPIRPPSNHKIKQDLMETKKSNPPSNVYIQGQKKGSNYTINQNNIVNIYLNDPKQTINGAKQLRINGSLTARGSSPPKLNQRKIYDCESHNSPQVSKKKI